MDRSHERYRGDTAAFGATIKAFENGNAEMGIPRTGDPVFVEEKWVPFFKTGKELRERLNPGMAGFERLWKDGKLTDAGMPNPAREVNDIAEGPDGAIWVTRGGRGTQSLARWHKGRWTEFGTASGLPEKPVWHPLFARDGTLWLTTEDAVYRKEAGRDRFVPTGIRTVPRATLAEAPDGTIWLTEKEQTRAIARNGALIEGGRLHGGRVDSRGAPA